MSLPLPRAWALKGVLRPFFSLSTASGRWLPDQAAPHFLSPLPLSHRISPSCDVDLGLNGLDVMAFVSPPPHPTTAQPLRLKLAGRAKFEGRLAAGPVEGSSPLPAPPSSFTGSVQLTGIR